MNGEVGWAWLMVFVSSAAYAQTPIFQAPYGPNGSWNLYQPISTPATWIDAHRDAQSRVQLGVLGHLVDIQSAVENNVVHFMAGGGEVWIGLTDREGVVVPTTNFGSIAPQESKHLADRSSHGWAWTSGAPFAFHAWSAGEPNDFQGEDAVHLRSDGQWNDLASGLAVDEPSSPALQPGTSGDERHGPRFRYVIEYPTQSTVKLDEALYPVFSAPDLMPPDIPGISGGNGFIGVTDFSMANPVTAPVLAVAQQLTEIVAGKRVSTAVADSDQTITLTDVSDRNTNVHGGPVLSATPFGFPGGGGNNFISVAKGWVQVAESGTYTVQVHSDDGFVLELPGNPFVESRGRGSIQDGILYYAGNTSDSDTLGRVELAAGVHELKFYSWNHDSGAYWEISTAQGAFPTNATYLGIGDSRQLPPRTSLPAARLARPATLAQVTEVAGGASSNIEVARQIVDSAMAEGTALVRDDLDLLVIRDHDAICCGRPGEAFFSEAYQWPANEPVLGGTSEDLNHFSSGIFGQLVVDDGDDLDGETLQLTIGMFSSDGSQLRIQGADFLQASANADLSIQIEGDVTLTFPGNTGNSNALGLIELTEGVIYDFAGYHFEQTGDAGFEVFTALGDHLDGFNHAFSPLRLEVEPIISPANKGWALVERPALVGGDYNQDGVVNHQDINLQSVAMQDPNPDLEVFDENRDGMVNGSDRAIWIKTHVHSWFGDANLDGEFNSTDLVEIFQAGKYESGLAAGWAQGDWNGDMRFGSDDLVAAFRDGGYELGPSTLNVPEPTASLAILSSLSCLPLVRRARR